MACLLLTGCLLLPLPLPAPQGGGDARPHGAEGAAAVAEALGMPVREPETPFTHYHLEGRLRFRLADGRELVQRGRALLGGPHRLRYEVGDGQRSNVFLLASAEEAWVRRAGETEWRPYAAGALARECWLRWTLLRLPWELAAVLDGPAAADEAEEGARGKSEGARAVSRRYVFPGPGGQEAVLVLGPDHRPRSLALGSSRVEVADWRPLAGGRLVPHRWLWQQPRGGLVEELERVEPGALFLARAFRPPGSGPAAEDWSARILAPGGVREGLREEVALVERPPAAVLRGPWPADWAAPLQEAGLVLPGVWEEPEAPVTERALVLLRGVDDPGPLPPGVRRATLEGGAWLRWSRVAALAPAAALERLAEVARQNGLGIRGPGLVLKARERGRMEALLPVSLPRNR